MNKNLKVLSLDENFITAYVYAIEKEKFDLAVSAKAEIQITDVWKIIVLMSLLSLQDTRKR